MPKLHEICEITCNGIHYRDWTQVNVKRSFGAEWAAEFQVSVVEMSDRARGWNGLKLKPGDAVGVTLGGKLAVTGLVDVRQSVINARSHGVQIQGCSNTVELVRSAAILEPGYFKNSAFDAIARRALQPFGIQLQWKNPPPGANRPFKLAQVFHGETVFQFLERLARQRGIFIGDDASGNLIAGAIDPNAAPAAVLEEGRNILEARALIRDDLVHSRSIGFAQNSGSDSVWGAAASQIKATAENPAVGRYRPMVIIAEDPMTQRDLQDRVDREQSQRIGTSVQCSITVQGWHKPSGELWEPGEILTVKAPSLFPNPGGMQSLAVQTATYAQDPTGGTTTMLDMVLPQALASHGMGLPKGGSPNLFEPGNQPARPD
jgi:prophage tail gpP-like protein